MVSGCWITTFVKWTTSLTTYLTFLYCSLIGFEKRMYESVLFIMKQPLYQKEIGFALGWFDYSSRCTWMSKIWWNSVSYTQEWTPFRQTSCFSARLAKIAIMAHRVGNWCWSIGLSPIYLGLSQPHPVALAFLNIISNSLNISLYGCWLLSVIVRELSVGKRRLEYYENLVNIVSGVVFRNIIILKPIIHKREKLSY